MTAIIAHFIYAVRKNKQQHISLYLGWLRLRLIWYTSLKYTCKCPVMILAHTHQSSCLVEVSPLEGQEAHKEHELHIGYKPIYNSSH